MTDQERYRKAVEALKKLAGDVLWATIAATADDAPPCDWNGEREIDPGSNLDDCKLYLEMYRGWVRRRRQELDEAREKAWGVLKELGEDV
jgi:hypothetical protein